MEVVETSFCFRALQCITELGRFVRGIPDTWVACALAWNAGVLVLCMIVNHT